MIGIIDTFKKIFTGTDLIFKHALLFVFTGIIAIISLPLNELSSLKDLSDAQMLTILGMFFVTVIVSIYTAGYNYRFTHKSYDKDNNDILPQWNFSLFKDGFGVLGLYLVYSLYITVFCCLSYFLVGFISGLVGTLLKIPANIYNICLIVVLAIVFLFTVLYMFYMPLVVVDSAKELKLKGFLNPLKPLAYVKTLFLPYLILLLKLVPIYIVIYISQALCFALPNVLTYILSAFCGYLMGLYSLVYYYQLRQLVEYKHYKIQKELEE